jgi:hypothetical protein
MTHAVSSQRLPRTPALDLRPLSMVDKVAPGEVFLRVTGFSPTGVIPMVRIHTKAYLIHLAQTR